VCSEFKSHVYQRIRNINLTLDFEIGHFQDISIYCTFSLIQGGKVM
jgi:hypothetical protein